MDNNEQTKKRFRHPDRVTLNPTSLAKLAAWHEQITGRTKCLNVTKSNLVEWLIESHNEQLSNGECKQIKEKFFDEVRYHEWAMREYKKQKASGLQLTFTQFLADNSGIQAPSANQDKNKQPRSRKRTGAAIESAESKASDASQKNEVSPQ